MKKCTWCGKEYPDQVEVCLIDQHPLASSEPGTKPATAHPASTSLSAGWLPRPRGIRCTDLPAPALIHLDELESAFAFEEGFSRPDWRRIRAAIDLAVTSDQVSEAWTEAASQWCQRLVADLGGQYSARRSDEFLLVSALELAGVDGFLRFAEESLAGISAALGEAAWKPKYGKHVVLLFAELDDYYQYVSLYYREGAHPASGGCLIHKDYVHIAMPYGDGRSIRRTLIHELVHNCVVHLRLPLWLNEGLATTFERAAVQHPEPLLDEDLRDKHLAFWNPDTIQKFWAGASFGEPGEPNRLSYSLAEILVGLLRSDYSGFAGFVCQADPRDAGQSAAVDMLNADLGQVAGTFLGPGVWRPNRKAILELWKRRRESQQDPPKNA